MMGVKMIHAANPQLGGIRVPAKLFPHILGAPTKLTKRTFKVVGACGPRFAVIAWTVSTLAGFSRIHNRISTGFP